MDTAINPFVERIAVSRARLLLVYQSGMPRRSLIEQLAIRLSQQAVKSLVMRGSLRCTRDTVGHSPPVRERVATALPVLNASHRRCKPAIPKNEFLEASDGSY
jgi:hypothetical protein